MKSIYLFFLCFFPLSAWSACGLGLAAAHVTINWDLTFTTLAVQLTVTKTQAAACSYWIGISQGGAASYAARRAVDGTKEIRYQIYKDAGLNNIIKHDPDIVSADDVITGSFLGGVNLVQNVLYYLDVPNDLATTPNLVPAGTYLDTFAIDLYEGNDPVATPPPVDTQNVNLTINVPTMIDLSLVDTGGAFNSAQTTRSVDFGMLAPGQTAAFDLRVRTNAGFDIKFASTNSGSLAPTVNPVGGTGIPYLFYVNTVLTNLTTVLTSALSGAGTTGLSGLAYPMKIVIGNFTTGSQLAGTYEDNIQIEATTVE